MREDTPASDCSTDAPADVRLVKTAVMPSILRKSMSLVSMALLSASESVKSVMGSTSTAAGRNSRIVLCMKARCVSSP
jgi:hypothetical protein